jgi:hypothetical protein
MKKAEFVRVSCRPTIGFALKNANRSTKNGEAGDTVNALVASWRDGMKQALNVVVEVNYTTVMLEVAG